MNLNVINDAVSIYDNACRVIAFVKAAEGAPAHWQLLRFQLDIGIAILENIKESYNHSEAEIQLQCEQQLNRVFGPNGTVSQYRAKVKKIGDKLPELGKSGTKNFFHKYKWPFDADTIDKDVKDLRIWEEDFRELRAAIADALAQDTHRKVKNLQESIDEEQLEKLYDTLSETAPWEKVRQDVRICSKSPPDWVLQEDRFHAFANKGNSQLQELWGIGYFGVGKTMIASFVAHHLAQQIDKDRQRQLTAAVGIFYCNHKSMQEQSTDNILKSLCRQLLEKEVPSTRAIQLVQRFIKPRKSRSANDLTPLWLFQELIKEHKEVFIIVDALDECQAPLDLLEQLHEITSTTSALRLFITSRPDLGYYPSNIVNIQIRIVSKDEDMINFVHDGLQKFQKEQSQLLDSTKPLLDAISSPGKHDDITRTVVQSAKGKFLIAGLLLKSLQDCDEQKDFDSRLHGKTIEIGDIFEDYISRIRTQPQVSHRRLGEKALMWVLHAKRLLRAEELFQVLVMYDQNPSARLDTFRDKDPAILSKYTCGLLNHDVADGTISVHKGLQDAFEMPRQKSIYFDQAEAEMARVCLEYLSLMEFPYDDCKSDREIDIWIKVNPFLSYAAGQWGHHVKSSPESVFFTDNRPLDLVAYLQNKSHLACYSYALNPALKTMEITLAPTKGTSSMASLWARVAEHESNLSALHVAVLFGLDLVVEALLKNGALVDERSFDDFTPLHLACRLNLPNMVELLVRYGADPGYWNRENQSCLHTAAAEGFAEIVSIVLRERPRMLNRLNWFPNTPLNEALRNRRHDIAANLISRGADVEIETGIHKNYSALDWAAKYGVASVIPEILKLDRRLKKYSDTWYRKMVPALYLAIENHRNEAVGVLLDNDAPVAFTNHDPTYRTSLHVAASSGNDWAMQEILKRNRGRELPGYGLIIDLHSSRKETPLLLAVERRQPAVVKTLIRFGAKAKSYPDGRTPLHLAAIHDLPEIVEELLKHDLGLLNALCAGHKTALLLAAEHGRPAVAAALLKGGADPWIASDGGGTPLHWATSHARPNVVRILAQHALEHSIPHFLDVQNHARKTALHEAAEFDRGNVARILLESGASMLIRAGAGAGGTPLDWAVERGNGIVDQLISHASQRSIALNDFVDATHPHLSRTPLQIAIQFDREETAKKLMAARASPLRRGNGATAFHWAVSHNRFSIFKFMLTQVLEKLPPTCLDEAKNERDMAILHEAAQYGRDDMIREMLDAGASPLVANPKAATPFHWATSSGRTSTVRLLIDYASKYRKQGYLDYPNHAGMTALHEAVQYDRHGIAKLLLKAGASPLVRSPIAGTPFHWAASQGRYPILEDLLSHASKLQSPAYLDYQNFHGKTPSHEAAQYNRPRIVQRLVDEGASPTLQDNEGYNALHWAVVSENWAIIELLVQKAGKAILEQPTHFWKETPLHHAVIERKHDSLEKLLELNADTEAATAQGRTALHIAASADCPDVKMVRLLLAAGAKPEARDVMGASVLHEAARSGSEVLDAVLERCEAALVLNADDNGATPLHVAASYGDMESVKKLLRRCLDGEQRALLQCRRKDGRTAKDLALYQGKRGTYDFLVEQERLMTPAPDEGSVVQDEELSSSALPVLVP